METSWNTGALGTTYQQLSDWFRSGQNLQRKIEKSLCSWIELLLLSWGPRRLSHRCNAGGDWKLEF